VVALGQRVVALRRRARLSGAAVQLAAERRARLGRGELERGVSEMSVGASLVAMTSIDSESESVWAPPAPLWPRSSVSSSSELLR